MRLRPAALLPLAALAAVAGLLVAAPARAASTPGCSGAWFHPLTQTRAYDSGSRPVGAKAVKVSLAKLVPASACAVVGTVTGLAATATTRVDVYPVGGRPTAAALDLQPGRDSSDAGTVGLGKKASVDLAVATGTARLELDVAGYYSATVADAFVPRGPVRVLAPATVGAGATLTLTDAQLGVPAGTAAVALALTGSDSVATTVTAYAAGAAKPAVTTLTVGAGTTRSVLATVPIGTGGVTLANAAGTASLMADLHGWYSATATGSLFTTAPSTPPTVMLGPGATADVAVGVGAAAFTLTATGATATTTVQAYPTASAVPTTGTLAVGAGVTTPDLLVVPTSVDGHVRLRNSAGTVTLAVAVAGTFVPRPAGNDVSHYQCSGTSTTTTLPPGAASGIVNPTAGGYASQSPASCLPALESWARGTGDEEFYLPLVDFGDQSALWKAPVADAPQKVSCTSTSSAPGCAYDYGWGQAEYTLTAAGSDGASRAWWVDIEPGDQAWSVCTSRPSGGTASGCTAQPQSQNAQVIAGALAYLRGHVHGAGIYANQSSWSSLVGSATVSGEPAFSTYPEWYATGGLTRAQEVAACVTPFAGGTVTLVQSIAAAPGEADSALDYDLRC